MNSDVLKSEPLGARAASRAHKHRIRRQSLALSADVHRDASAVFLSGYRCDLRREKEFDSRLLEIPLKDARNVRIRRSRDLRKHLDNGDIAADCRKIRCGLKSDNAAADYDKLFRNLAQLENLAVGHAKSVFVSLAQPRHRRDHRFAPRADEKLFRGVGLAERGDGISVGALSGDRRARGNDRNTRALHLRGDTRNERAHDFVLAVNDLCMVDRRAGYGYTERLRMERAEVKLRGIEKSFRGNAALVQANASESALLEEDHFHSAVGGALGGIVSAGTSADYGKIVFHMLYRALDKASFLYLWYGERKGNGHGNGLGNLLRKGSLNLQNLSN